MRVPPRPVRRLGIPVYVVVLTTLVGVFVCGVVVGLLCAPFGSRRRPLRISAFGISYCLMELAVLVVSGTLWLHHAALTVIGRADEAGWHRRHRRLLTLALSWVIGAARRFAGFHLVVSDASIPSLSDRKPTLVLARHGGPGDSFVLVQLLLTVYNPDVRIVLKDVLQLDPALDIVLNRLGCCFIPSRAGTLAARQVDALAASLKPGDALLLFPEGANWTPNRRLAAIRRLRVRRQKEALRTAELMENVLPPRIGGVTSCLDAQPNLEVLVAAHAGLDRIVSARQLWDELPFSQPMTARLWKASNPPSDEAGRETWLTTEWAVVDQWIEAYHAGEIDQHGER